MARDTAPTVRRRHISEYRPQPEGENARAHTPRNIGMIVDAIQEVGAARSGVADEDSHILAGSGTYEAMVEAGIEDVIEVEADGNQWVIVRRPGLDEDQKQRLALYDNRTAELAQWGVPVLADMIEDDAESLEGLFRDDELADLGVLDAILAEPEPERLSDEPETEHVEFEAEIKSGAVTWHVCPECGHRFSEDSDASR